MNTLPLAGLYFLLSAVFCGLPFTTSNTLLQSLYLAVGSALLAVFLGLIAVNLILNSNERKQVAAPLLRLIGELAEPLHNEFFIRLGRNTFGSDRFNELIQIYQKNQNRPDAFSPEDLDRLFQMVMSKKDELVEIYTRVEVTARDVASILGWGYDPKILRVVLSTRSEILSITRYMAFTEHDLAAKRKVVENYIDIEGSIGAWVDGLAKKLGISVTEEG